MVVSGIDSLAAMFALIAPIGLYVRKGDSVPAILLLLTAPVFAIVFSWSWTGSLFTLLEWAKRYIAGVEGDHRHEWYSFKGQRVRVLLDEMQQFWFALNEIAFILALEIEQRTIRHYGPHEHGIPESASESCLSESGLRRLNRYGAHPDAGALGIWLDRDVLRGTKKKKGNPGNRRVEAERVDFFGAAGLCVRFGEDWPANMGRNPAISGRAVSANCGNSRARLEPAKSRRKTTRRHRSATRPIQAG
jgi:hypothetical protein